MKKPNWILLIGLGVAAWYFFKKKPSAAAAMQTILPGSAARHAASDAKQIVSDVVDQTTFLPDTTTDRQLYAQDLKNCK